MLVAAERRVLELGPGLAGKPRGGGGGRIAVGAALGSGLGVAAVIAQEKDERVVERAAFAEALDEAADGAVIIVGFVLGAITGTVAASVIAMGMISLPIMMRYGYDMRIATGVIAASGTITQLIPPSLVLIVLGDQLGKSVGDMYAGAIGPSILQIVLFMLFILGVSIFAPHKVPPLPPEALSPRGWPLYWRVLKGMVPSIVLIFLVLGTIFLGLATPTEAGAMGAVGALVLAAMHKRLTWKLVREGMESTMRLTAMVIFILIGSTVFTLVFQGVDGGVWIEHMLTSMTGGDPVTFLIIVNIFVFFLAFFLDFFEIAFIIIPLLAPVAAKLGIDLIWFGVLLCNIFGGLFISKGDLFILYLFGSFIGLLDTSELPGILCSVKLTRKARMLTHADVCCRMLTHADAC
jgi:tripartite ATP-independent transporter DctM subunit